MATEELHDCQGRGRHHGSLAARQAPRVLGRRAVDILGRVDCPGHLLQRDALGEWLCHDDARHAVVTVQRPDPRDEVRLGDAVGRGDHERPDPHATCGALDRGRVQRGRSVGVEAQDRQPGWRLVAFDEEGGPLRQLAP